MAVLLLATHFFPSYRPLNVDASPAAVELIASVLFNCVLSPVNCICTFVICAPCFLLLIDKCLSFGRLFQTVLSARLHRCIVLPALVTPYRRLIFSTAVTLIFFNIDNNFFSLLSLVEMMSDCDLDQSGHTLDSFGLTTCLLKSHLSCNRLFFLSTSYLCFLYDIIVTVYLFFASVRLALLIIESFNLIE